MANSAFDPSASVPSAASQAEQETGTATNVYVSPGRQQFHYTAMKMWVSYDQTTPSINASYNVTSVTDSSTGNFQINFTNNFTDIRYEGSGTAGDESTTYYAICQTTVNQVSAIECTVRSVSAYSLTDVSNACYALAGVLA